MTDQARETTRQLLYRLVDEALAAPQVNVRTRQGIRDLPEDGSGYRRREPNGRKSLLLQWEAVGA